MPSIFSSKPQTIVLTGVAAALGLALIIKILREKNRSSRRRVLVCSTLREWNSIANEVLTAASEGLIGLDCEWVSTKDYRGKVALLQLAVSEDLCVLIRLNKMKLPSELAKVLSDHNVIKLGVAVQDDADKLMKDFGIRVNSCLDIRYMLTEEQKGPLDKQTLSLASLAHRFAGMTLDKSLHIRISNWEASELSDAQIQYAADDAFAGLRVAHALLRSWTFERPYKRCVNEFVYFLGIPYRKGPTSKNPNINVSAKQPPNIKSTPPRRLVAIRKDQQLYKNAVLQAPDGEILCSTDKTKTQWYLRNGLGTLISEDPMVVRLNFEPRCRAILGGEYYVDEKLNICVVCGSPKDLLKKNVVPQEYRKLFPALMKSHTSHDSVLMCSKCHHISGSYDSTFREQLDSEFPLTIDVPNIAGLKKAARALLRAPQELPPERALEFKCIIEEYFQQPVSDEVLKNAFNLDIHTWLRNHNATHAQRVITGYSKGKGLFALETRWRKHFLECMKPKHLPDKWSLTHNQDAVLMKVATGRDIGEHTVESFISILGVDWRRMAEITTAIIEEGFVEPSKVVIWDLLKSKGFTFDFKAFEQNGNFL